MNIGDWVRRQESGSKWHIVESVIAGAAITGCGRRMEPTIQGGAGLEVSDVMPDITDPQRCRVCMA